MLKIARISTNTYLQASFFVTQENMVPQNFELRLQYILNLAEYLILRVSDLPKKKINNSICEIIIKLFMRIDIINWSCVCPRKVPPQTLYICFHSNQRYKC